MMFDPDRYAALLARTRDTVRELQADLDRAEAQARAGALIDLEAARVRAWKWRRLALVYARYTSSPHVELAELVGDLVAELLADIAEERTDE